MVSYRRITYERVSKYLKATAIVVSTILGLFTFLVYLDAVTITGYSNDMVCAGTEKDPCYAYINFTPKVDIFIYPDQNWYFDVEPPVEKIIFQRSWGNGWRTIDLTKGCTGSWCGCYWCRTDQEAGYSYVFRKDREYQIRYVGYKKDPKDTIKWSFGNVDPFWFGKSTNKKIIIPSSDMGEIRYNGDYVVLSSFGNENLYNVSFENIPIYDGKTFQRNETIICMESNFDQRIVTELVNKSYTYNVPKKMPFYKTNQLAKQPDIDRELVKANPISATPNDFESGDKYRFCYQANPEEDFYLKFGNDSIIIIQENYIFSRSYHVNTTYDGNFSHLLPTTDSPYDDLGGLYPFDFNTTSVYDYTNNNNDGIIANGALWNNSGWDEGAYQFDRVNDLISLGSDSSIDIPNNFTITAWIKPYGAGENSEGAIFAKSADSSFIFAFWSTNALETQLDFSTTDALSISTGTLSTNVWTHVAVAFNGTTLKLYANGNEMSYATKTPGSGSRVDRTSEVAYIGNTAYTSRTFNGLIDEVMIFNTLLTDQQIDDIYKNQSSRYFYKGTQKVRAVMITNETNWDNNDYNKVNLTVNYETNYSSNISARIGQITTSVNVSNLTLYMPFEWGTGNNIVNQKDGTATGVTFGETNGLNESGGLSFDGILDYVEVPYDDIFNDTVGTISVWIYPTSISVGDSPVSFANQDGGLSLIFNNEYGWAIESSASNTLRFCVSNGTDKKCTDNTAIPLNVWTHVLATMNSTHIEFYKNGVRTQLNNSVPLMGLSYFSFMVGAVDNAGVGNACWNGKIDEVLLWNKTLASTEISTLYSDQLAANHKVQYSSFQNITGNPTTYTIDEESDFIFPDFIFYAGNSTNPFYTPILKENITLETYYITEAVGDTCDCSSIQGGTPIDCSENCDIEACDAGGVDINFINDGTIIIDGDITNYGNVNIRGTSLCVVRCNTGCFKR